MNYLYPRKHRAYCVSLHAGVPATRNEWRSEASREENGERELNQSDGAGGGSMYDRMKQQQEFIMYVSYMQSYNNGLTHACPNVTKKLTSEKVYKS